MVSRWLCIAVLFVATLFVGDVSVTTLAHAMLPRASTARVICVLPSTDVLRPNAGIRLAADTTPPPIKKPKPSDPPCKCWHWSNGKKTCHPCDPVK
jgi:hypothetical protein